MAKDEDKPIAQEDIPAEKGFDFCLILLFALFLLLLIYLAYKAATSGTFADIGGAFVFWR
ncbi:hypothetical protein KY358_04700 [Candidatus Woesearchaeota archaeon]|nr:hypothetical protein [Candidatus Woesearchaeota archaeon]